MTLHATTLDFSGTVRGAVVEDGATALTDNYLEFAIEGGCGTGPWGMADFSLRMQDGRLVGRERVSAGIREVV